MSYGDAGICSVSFKIEILNLTAIFGTMKIKFFYICVYNIDLCFTWFHRLEDCFDCVFICCWQSIESYSYIIYNVFLCVKKCKGALNVVLAISFGRVPTSLSARVRVPCKKKSQGSITKQDTWNRDFSLYHGSYWP